VTARLSYTEQPLMEMQREAIMARLYSHPTTGGNFEKFPWAAAQDLFTPGQWEEVVREARQTGLLPP
jgi:hypothetical protein